MPKRTLIVLSLTIAVLIAVAPLQTARGVLMTEEEVAMAVALDAAANEAAAPDNGQQGGRGNIILRVLKAPFKAIGRLFGRGKKDDNKLHRLSEKDVKKFEAAPTVRIKDATSVEPDISADSSASIGFSEAEMHLAKGRALLDAGNVNDAIAELSLAVAADQKLAEAHNLLGVAYEQKGLREFAFRAFRQALRGDKDDPQHLNNYGYLLYRNGDYKDAIKYLKRAARLAPGDQRIWNNLGLAQAEAGRFDDAYESFARAVGEFDGHLNVAIRLQRQGYQKDAIEHLERARELQPNSAEVLARLGALYDSTGRPEQAVEARQAFYALQSVANAPNQK